MVASIIKRLTSFLSPINPLAQVEMDPFVLTLLPHTHIDIVNGVPDVTNSKQLLMDKLHVFRRLNIHLCYIMID